MIPITVTTIKATNYVTPTSRYASSDVIMYGNESIITFATYIRGTYPINSADKYAVIPPNEEFRPDKTSLRAYGTVDLWWKILEANNIADIFDYKTGTNIRIPTVSGF